MNGVPSSTTDTLQRAILALATGVIAISLAACDQGQQTSGEAASPAAAKEDTAAAAPGKSMEGMDHAHHMTPEQFTELRQKILPYREMSDEAIMENMGRMPADFWSMISPPDMQGTIGVLALGHGYTLGGNEQFENYAQPISKVHPTAVAPGMAMMSSSHIQQAVDELTGKHGVTTIVVVPMEPGDNSSLNRQWKYIFGLQEEAPYLSVPRVKTSAKIVFAKSPASDTRISTILKDHGVEASANPEKDRLILVSHGPETVEANPAELALLETHAERIRQASGFKDVTVVSLQDDAVPPVRAAHVQELRGLIKEATDQGRHAVIVPLILTKGGFHARLQKDLTGLDYRFANKGLIEHPAFQEWIRDTVSAASVS